jgi:cystathionine gamma-synthase
MTRKQATIAVRSGLNDDEQYGCVVPPIHLSSTYNFTGFNEPRAHDYSRRGNPTRDVTQRALAELEGGAGAVLTNTGMSAIHLVTTVFLKPATCWLRRTTATAAAIACLTAWQNAAAIACCLSIKTTNRR